MTDNTQELDEILRAFDNWCTKTGFKGEPVLSRVKAKQALLDWHYKQVLEIIGEDELPEGLTSWYDGIERDSMHREGRNMLREWQRNKLTHDTTQFDTFTNRDEWQGKLDKLPGGDGA